MRGLSTGSLRIRLAGCCACAALALALVAAAPATAALGSNSAFKELVQSQPQSQPEAKTSKAPKKTAATTTPSEPTNSHTTIFLAMGAAVLLLSGIAVVIARDARRVAPAGDPEAVERDHARDTAARLRRRRAKAKAARQQRKRNRQVG